RRGGPSASRPRHVQGSPAAELGDPPREPSGDGEPRQCRRGDDAQAGSAPVPSGRAGGSKTWAWGDLANAHRVANNLAEAEQAFGKAFEYLLQGTGDPYIKARLHDLHASFLGTRREFDLAFA